MRSALAALLLLTELVGAGCGRQPVPLLDAGPADGAGSEGGPSLPEAIEVALVTAISQSLRFTLVPSPGGAVVAPYALPWDPTPQVGTSMAPGSYADGVLRLGPFNVRFVSPSSLLQSLQAVEAAQLEARYDAATHTLEGTLSGQALSLDSDLLRPSPMTATLFGHPDVTPPLVKPTKLSSPQAVTRVPALGFSEPVRLAEGATLATLTAGPVVITVPFAGGSDPGRTIGQVLVPLQGHLPFGVTVTLEVASAATDLAGNALAAPLAVTYQTIADPGLLANPSFEAGAAGFVTTGAALQIIEQTAEYPAKEGTRYARWDPSSTSSSVTFRLSLPASAKRIVLAVDGHSSAYRPLAGVSLSASTTSARVAGALQLPSPTGAGPLGLKRTGWTDVALEVSTLAGEEVVVTLDHPPFTGTFGQVYLDLDDIRVEDQ